MAERKQILTDEEAKCFLKSKQHLLSTPNVVSLGFYHEKVDGENTTKKIFRVGVIKKLPKEDIKHPDIFVPKLFEHTPTGSSEMVIIPVKVVEEGEILISLPDAEGVSSPMIAPYKGGSLIRNRGLTVFGCLGANAQFKGSYRLLSAAHVLTRYDRNNVGKPIDVVDANQWVPLGVDVTDQVDVQLYDDPNVANPVRSRQDLAWADITASQGSPEIIDIGTPKPIRLPVVDEKTKFYAGYTGALETDVPVADVSASMRSTLTISGAKKYAFFEDLCRIDQPIIVQAGDSGTAIVAENDDSLVGILHSTGMIASYFCKLT